MVVGRAPVDSRRVGEWGRLIHVSEAVAIHGHFLVHSTRALLAIEIRYLPLPFASDLLVGW